MGSSVYTNVFFMLGGIAILMLGMKMMGSNLEQIAGNNMKKMLGKVTSNRFAGVGIGAGVTAIINSSTATTVMLVGFVNVGLLTLSQAASVIMGANIGTTITTLIMAVSGGTGIDVAAYAALIAALGTIISMFAKKDKVRKTCNILIGIGLIFVGLKIMSVSVDFIVWEDKANRVFRFEWLRTLLQGNVFPLLLILIGIVLTAIVHSSAAITGILIALGSAINFQTAVFIILGSNIGTCITSLVSSIGTSTNARRTAIIHLLFNVFGCLICIAPVWIWGKELGDFMQTIIGDSMEWKIAIFHTVFNVFTTAILLPFIKPLVLLAEKIIPEKKNRQSQKHTLTFIDNRLLQTPPIAVSNTKKEIIKMATIAKENLDISTEMLLNKNVDKKDLLRDNEEALNFLNRSITSFLTKVMSTAITSSDEKKLGSYYHVVSDIERIGDYSENLMEYTEKMIADELEFSDEAKAELSEVTTTLSSLFYASVEVFTNKDLSLLSEVDILEESVDQAAQELENRHVERLKKGDCDANTGSIYLQTVSDLERIGDHITNIAYSIKNYRHRS